MCHAIHGILLRREFSPLPCCNKKIACHFTSQYYTSRQQKWGCFYVHTISSGIFYLILSLLHSTAAIYSDNLLQQIIPFHHRNARMKWKRNKILLKRERAEKNCKRPQECKRSGKKFPFQSILKWNYIFLSSGKFFWDAEVKKHFPFARKNQHKTFRASAIHRW